MTSTVLHAEDPRSDAHTLAGSPVNEPTVNIVGGSTAVADGSDSTYVSLDGGQPNLGIGGNSAHTPGLVAHLPAIPTAIALNSLSFTVRTAVVANAWTTATNLYGTFQVFRYVPGGTLPDPYEVNDTTTLYNFDFNGSTGGSSYTAWTLTPSLGSFTVADIALGNLYVRWTVNLPPGESNVTRVSEISAAVDYTGRRPPLRQWPRNDGLRSNPSRQGAPGPTSRQGSLRRGPCGTYT